MKKILYYNVPAMKKLHKNIKGLKLFKGHLISSDLKKSIETFDYKAVVISENDWKKEQNVVSVLDKKTKLIVLSDDDSVLELSDAIITTYNQLKTKNNSWDLNKNPLFFYLWSLGTESVSKCIKCSNLSLQNIFKCDCCGSEKIEIMAGKNHLE